MSADPQSAVPASANPRSRIRLRSWTLSHAKLPKGGLRQLAVPGGLEWLDVRSYESKMTPEDAELLLKSLPRNCRVLVAEEQIRECKTFLKTLPQGNARFTTNRVKELELPSEY